MSERVYKSTDKLIGKTPLLELTHLEKEFELSARILAKLEYFNPAGSVKDRIAKVMIWGQRHQRFLKECHRIRYYNLLTTGKLNPYLAEIDCCAEEMFAMLVKELSEKEDVTEALKSMFPMEWVRKMNNIRNRAMEIVNSEVIFQ